MTDAYNFFTEMLTAKNKRVDKSDHLESKLYDKPKKDTVDDKIAFEHVTPNYWQMADTLFLPNDKGYIYCLVVADVGSRLCDAEPMQNKDDSTILKAFQVIYKRGILKKPIQITTDQGTEFKGETKKGLLLMGINMNYAKVGRHRQVSLVERKNQSIGKMIHKLLIHDQLASGNVVSHWVDVLPIIVKVINEKVAETKPPLKIEFPKKSKFTVTLLNEGDKVRVMLDNPEDLNGNKLFGKGFRSGDIRFKPEIRTVKYISIKPMQPPMYFLNGNVGLLKIEPVGYTRNQLQLVSDNEVTPSKPILEVDSDRMEVQSILDKKTVKKTVYYLIKWKDLPKNEASWEKESSLIEDIPQMIARFNKKLDKKK